MAVPIIRTFGYANGSVEALCAFVTSNRLRLLDVRMYASSRHRPEFNKAALITALGPRYEHAAGFGNANMHGDQGEGIILSNPQAGMKAVARALDAGVAGVVLMCCEASPFGCHRRVVADVVCQALGAAKHSDIGRRELMSGSLAGEVAPAPPALPPGCVQATLF